MPYKGVGVRIPPSAPSLDPLATGINSHLYLNFATSNRGVMRVKCATNVRRKTYARPPRSMRQDTAARGDPARVAVHTKGDPEQVASGSFTPSAPCLLLSPPGEKPSRPNRCGNGGHLLEPQPVLVKRL